MTSVAGVQLNGAPADKDVNIAKASRYVKGAAKKGAKIVVLQELFATGYFPTKIDQKFFDQAESDDGKTLSAMKELAKEEGIWLVAPFFEVEKNVIGRYYDSAAVISPDGGIIGKYRKLHLPNIYWTQEKFYFAPGNLGSPVFDCGDVKLGIMICYDRHYPELGRIMVLRGATLLVVPTMTTKKPGRENVWVPELIALAANNHVYVLGVNSTGMQEGKAHFGHSVFIDPFGQVVSELKEEEGNVYGSVDESVLRDARNTYNHLRDIRPDVYETLLHLVQPQK
jgi:beta-ureidopropionase